MTSIIEKSFNIMIRTLARPIIEWIIKHKKEDLSGKIEFGILGRLLSKIGQKWNVIQVKVNRKSYGISSLSEIKPLSNEKALEKGTEVFTEFTIYSLLIFIPIIEWRRQGKVSKVKENKEKEYLNSINEKLRHLKLEEEILEGRLIEINKKIIDVDEKIRKKMEIDNIKYNV